MAAERNVTIALAATTEALDAGLKDAEGKLKDFQKKASGGGGGKLGDPGNTLGFGKIADVMGKVVIHAKALEGGLTAVTAVSKLLRGDLEGADKAAEKIPLGIGTAYSAIKSAGEEVRQLALMWGGLAEQEAKATKTLEEYAEFTKRMTEMRKEKLAAAPGLANEALAKSKGLAGQFGREAEIASYQGGPSQAIREAQLERDDRMNAARERIKANPKDRRIADAANTEMAQAAEAYRQKYDNIVRELADKERQANQETANMKLQATLNALDQARLAEEAKQKEAAALKEQQDVVGGKLGGAQRAAQIAGMNPQDAAAAGIADEMKGAIADFDKQLAKLPGGIEAHGAERKKFADAQQALADAKLGKLGAGGGAAEQRPPSWQEGFRQVEGRMSFAAISQQAEGMLGRHMSRTPRGAAQGRPGGGGGEGGQGGGGGAPGQGGPLSTTNRLLNQILDVLRVKAGVVPG